MAGGAMEIIQWIVAAGTTIFVAMVGYYQWRTAEQKAVLDLFERRHEIYQIVFNSVGQMCRNSLGFDAQQEREFVLAMGRAYFFFGDDVQEYLTQLWKDITDVRAGDAVAGTPAFDANAVQRRQAALLRINQFYESGRPLFARDMRFSQTMPSGVWSEAVERINSIRGRKP
jgi:hypothetical protein